MTDQVYSNLFQQDSYWLSSTGVKQVYFNKLSSPPFSILNHGILYELDDGVLYFNGQAISNDAGGDVAGPTSSYTDAVAVYADTTGKVIKNSNLILVPTDNSVVPALYSSLQASPGNLYQPFGYNADNNVSIGCGSSLPYAQFINSSTVNTCIFLGTSAGVAMTGMDVTEMVVLGDYAGESFQTGTANVFVGSQAGSLATSCDYCTYVGYAAGGAVPVGNNNIAIGNQAGLAWSSNESNNICIGFYGSPGDNTTIKIGDPTIITQTNIAGIYTNDTVVGQPVICNANGTLGTLTTASSSFSGTSLMTGANANIVPGFMSSVVYDASSTVYCWPAPSALSFQNFAFRFSRPIAVGESIDVRLIINGTPILQLSNGAWGTDFNPTTPQTGSATGISGICAMGDLLCILVNSYTTLSNFYMNWTLN